ncbi:hypothetical protein IJ182_09805 [bacterium]|nr:hypothetical protein [bacterium]
MKKNMLLIGFETTLFIIILLAALVNLKSNTTSQFAASFDGTYVIVSTFFVIISAYLFGLFSGCVYSLVLGARYKDQIEFYARKNEKLSQQSEIDTDDKEVLQRKIATLEIALDNALKNKQ